MGLEHHCDWMRETEFKMIFFCIQHLNTYLHTNTSITMRATTGIILKAANGPTGTPAGNMDKTRYINSCVPTFNTNTHTHI